jgi:hypothetical protein
MLIDIAANSTNTLLLLLLAVLFGQAGPTLSKPALILPSRAGQLLYCYVSLNVWYVPR